MRLGLLHFLAGLATAGSTFSVQIAGPGLFAHPNPKASLSIAQGPYGLIWGPTSPLALTWSSSTSDTAAPTLDGVSVEIVSGCQPSDTLSAPSGTSSSGCRISAPRSASFDDYTAWLNSVSLQVNSSNVAPRSLQRLLRLQVLGTASAPALATAFAFVSVQPNNTVAVLPSPATQPILVPIPEGALPDFAVVLLASCAGVTSVHGLPTVCLEDPDPPYVRATSGMDAYAGPANSPLSVLPASTYSIAFSTPTVVSPLCSLYPAIVAVGAPLWDCSPAAQSSSASASPLACYFQRFRLTLPVPGLLSASPTPSPGSSPSMTPTPSPSPSPTSTPASTRTQTPSATSAPAKKTLPIGAVTTNLAGGDWYAPPGGCNATVRLRGGGGGGALSIYGYSPGGHAAEFNVSFWMDDASALSAIGGKGGAVTSLYSTPAVSSAGSGGGGASALILSSVLIAVAGGGGGGAEAGGGGSFFRFPAYNISSGGNAGAPGGSGDPGNCAVLADKFSGASASYGGGQGGTQTHPGFGGTIPLYQSGNAACSWNDAQGCNGVGRNGGGNCSRPWEIIFAGGSSIFGNGGVGVTGSYYFGGGGGGGGFFGGGSGYSSVLNPGSCSQPARPVSCGGGGGSSFLNTSFGALLLGLKFDGGALRYPSPLTTRKSTSASDGTDCPSGTRIGIRCEPCNYAGTLRDCYPCTITCSPVLLSPQSRDALFNALDGEVTLLSCVPPPSSTPSSTPSRSPTPSLSSSLPPSPSTTPPPQSASNFSSSLSPSPSSSPPATPSPSAPPLEDLTSGNSSLSSMRCTTCALDAEAVYCNDIFSTEGLPLTQLQLRTSLTLSDSLFGSFPPSRVTVQLALHLIDIPEATVVVAPDPSLLNTPMFPSSVASSLVLSIDDRTGLPASTTTPYFLMCSQDESSAFSFSSQLQFNPLPAEGSASLPPGYTIGSLFDAHSVSTLESIPLSSAPFCQSALHALAPSNSTAADATMGLAFVWVQAFTLQAAQPNILSKVPARSLTLSLWAGAAGESKFSLRVLLTRTNANVSLLTSPYTLPESALPGTLVGNVSAADLDTDQNISFSLLSVTVTQEGTTPRTALPGLFSLVPVSSPFTTTDFATGIRRTLNLTRSAEIRVGRDAMYGCKSGSTPGCTFLLTLAAQDSGDFSASHSLLPLAASTVATQVVSITITDSVGSSLRAALGPPGGLSAAGGDPVEFVGVNLGLPDGNATSPVPPFTNAFLFTPALPQIKFPLLNCTIATRLVRVRCITSPGWSPNASSPLRLHASILGQTDSPPAASSPWILDAATNLSYAAPAPLAVGNSSAAFPTLGTFHALLSSSPAYVNASAALLLSAPLPSASTGWYVPTQLASLQPPAAATATLFQGNFSLLVGNVPSQALLAQSGSCLSLHALLLTTQGALLPIGRCAQRATSAAAFTSTYLGAASTAAVLAPGSSAVFDCPLPQLASGVWHSVSISTQAVAPASSCTLSPAASASLGAFTPSTLPAPYLAAYQALRSNYAGALTSATPVITAVTQSSAGGRFTISGDNLGSAATARAEDAVEYFVLGAGASAGSASIAVLKGIHCLYTGARSVECDLDPAGWGSGYSVRVVVGGSASAAFTPPPQSVPWYPPPGSLKVTVGMPVGTADPSLAGLLAPSGGTLLALNGTGLWPPSALSVAVGGILLQPINLRDLALYQGSSALAYASCASAQSAGRLPTNSLGCFGDPQAPFSSTLPAPPPLLFSAPPGFGTVDLSVCLGQSTQCATPTPLKYAPPTFSSLTLLGQIKFLGSTEQFDYTLGLSASSLSPCLLCLQRAGSLPPLATSCGFRLGVRTGAPNAATLRTLPSAGSLEGLLPAPSQNVSLQACALPSAYFTLTAGVRVLSPGVLSGALLPSLNLSLVDASGSRAVTVLSALFSPPALGDKLSISTPSTGGNLSLTVSAFPGDPQPQTTFLFYDKNLLTLPDVVVNSVTPTTWAARGGDPVLLTLNNAKQLGAVRLYPEGTYSAANSTTTPASAASNSSASASTPWPSDRFITCPITNLTLITQFDDQGYATELNAMDPSWSFASPPSPSDFVASPWYLSVDSAGLGTWVRAPRALPCWVTAWQYSAVPRNNLRVAFVAPAWAGTLDLVLQSSTQSPPVPVAYKPPTLAAVAPLQGPTSGSVITLTGVNFGAYASLGQQWAVTTLSNASAAAESPAAPLGASMVYFSYLGSVTELFRRTCAVIAWSDSSITCTAPEGVSGSPNPITVALQVPAAYSPQANTYWREIKSTTATFTYQSANLSSTTPPSIRAFQNSTIVTLYGTSLSRFNYLPPSASAAELAAAGLPLSYAAPADASVSSPPFPCFLCDATLPPSFYRPQGQYWTPFVLASVLPTTGLVNGATDTRAIRILALNHTAVTFVLPPIEGTVDFSLLYRDGGGEEYPSIGGAVPLRAVPPTLTSVRPRSADEAGVDDADPCTSLAAAPPPNSTAACILSARAVHPAPPPPSPSMRPASAPMPAPRACSRSCSSRASTLALAPPSSPQQCTLPMPPAPRLSLPTRPPSSRTLPSSQTC